MRRNSSKVTGKKTPESRNQPGSSLMNADSTGLIADDTDPPGPVGLALGMRAALLPECTCFLLGIWPLLSASRWKFLWTLLYLNSPMNSERIAGRLLCNSATKCRGLKGNSPTPLQTGAFIWQVVHDTRRLWFLFSLSEIESTWLQVDLIVMYIYSTCISPDLEFFLHFLNFRVKNYLVAMWM